MAVRAAALLAVVLAVNFTTASARGEKIEDGPNPVSRVVKLLTEMKQQVESEADEDAEIYAKMGCWCETYDKEKTEAIKVAEERIESLTSLIEEGTATAGRLEGEIAQLQAEIQDSQDALETAVAMREKEKAEFEDEEKDMKDALAALKEAIAVLSKVQLLQAKGRVPAQALVQVRSLVSRVTRAVELLPQASGGAARYRAVMQKDLWDMLGDIGGAPSPRVLTGLSQSAQPTGAAAGATSYSARSSTIFGILSQMQATFNKNLASSQKEELEAEIAFQRLKAAKVSEIEAAGKAAEEKTAELADTHARVAQAKKDLEDTREALAADQAFLVSLKKRCATAEEEHASRQKTRQEEIVAIGEAISILTQDDARDLFSKTLSLLQTAAGSGAPGLRRGRAAAALLAVAKRLRGGAGGLMLARLAVGVRLDGFERVKELMDKMVVELKKQQKEEFEKHEGCKSDIDANEDATRVKQSEKKDLESQLARLEGELAQLSADLEGLRAEVAEAHVSLKAAGEQRKAENHEFQQVVADQRATVQILNKALTRLKSFYVGKGASFLARGRAAAAQEPGAAVPPPPAAGKAYAKSAGAGGVIQIMEKIIQDATKADQEAVLAEQSSQEAYAGLVSETNTMLAAAETSINEKTIQQEKSTADKLIAEKDLAAVGAALEDLAGQNKALHLACDYLLLNYNVRQQARQDEIEAIQEAKAILSGANFDA